MKHLLAWSAVAVIGTALAWAQDAQQPAQHHSSGRMATAPIGSKASSRTAVHHEIDRRGKSRAGSAQLAHTGKAEGGDRQLHELENQTSRIVQRQSHTKRVAVAKTTTGERTHGSRSMDFKYRPPQSQSRSGGHGGGRSSGNGAQRRHH